MGNRWGRTCDARRANDSYRFFIVFTPEGMLRHFDPLDPLPTVPADESEAEVAGADASETVFEGTDEPAVTDGEATEEPGPASEE